ncbi:hypothetical protein CFE70_007784 [Pyrenophora teres f. teres 0-1]|uniref:MYND-type domain-containing protein n=1 Tax=Pyrenophora teres f. teres (strain 0-1) TaxID=861557 RepID=E3S935_PYRTT|nr:hypothetical protein PTT_19525 [Pyrenophora teres f. teres 0-1]KAK1912513.1 hypothetical protein P3342_010116 [Pyrenophora teres f. teres]
MAMRRLNLEFCPMSAKGIEEWRTTTELPEDLFGPLSLQETPAHRARLIPAVSSMLLAYQNECNTKITASSSTCVSCDVKAATAFLRPLSFLHLTTTEDGEDGPLVRIYVIPLCKKPDCLRMATFINEDIMDRTLEEQKAQVAPGKQCPCGISVGTMACAKCRVASYCGREHQKRDYKDHKKICYVLQSMREMSEGQRMWFREGEEAASSSLSSTTKPKSSTTKSSPTQSSPPKTPKSSEPTRKVRIHCAPIGAAPAWDTTAQVPTSLIGQFTQPLPPTYQATFDATMQPLVATLQPDFNSRSDPICLICQVAPTTFGISFCMSQLQAPEPFIIVGIVPTCGSQQCKEGAYEMNKMFQQEQSMHDAVNACKICGKYEGARKCVRCKTVAYCGEEHQRQDWPSHKRECRQLAMTKG